MKWRDDVVLRQIIYYYFYVLFIYLAMCSSLKVINFFFYINSNYSKYNYAKCASILNDFE